MPLTETYNRDDLHDRWKKVYRASRFQDGFNDTIMERIMKALDLRPDSLVLDAGCGSGEHSARIAKSGHRCIGVDLSRNVLRRARERSRALGLDARLSFSCHALESLAFPDETFDAVHCRGVLMHIPDWETALASLCRVLKPGGRIVILEANDRSIEAGLTRLARRFIEPKSKLRETPGGPEFWSAEDGRPFVRRMARISRLVESLERNGVRPESSFATEFWDLNLFPAGILRWAASRFNRLWFSSRGPRIPASGNAVIGVRSAAASAPSLTRSNRHATGSA